MPLELIVFKPIFIMGSLGICEVSKGGCPVMSIAAGLVEGVVSDLAVLDRSLARTHQGSGLSISQTISPNPRRI